MLIDVMHTLSSMMEQPVIALLIALVVIVVVIVGMLIAEVFTEHRYFRLSLPKLIDDLTASGDPEATIRESGMLGRQKAALLELLSHPDATPSERESLAVNLVAQEQHIFDTRVKITDLISKVAPMLGLMGTLIPLGPGILAIGEGETSVLAESLLVAFDTTVLGLLVAAVALCVSTVRKSWYAKYMAAFEAAAECTLEWANEHAGQGEEAARSERAARNEGAERSRSSAQSEKSTGRNRGITRGEGGWRNEGTARGEHTGRNEGAK